MDLKSFLTISRVSERWNNLTALRLTEIAVEIETPKDMFLVHSLNRCKMLEKLAITVSCKEKEKRNRNVHVSLPNLKFLEVLTYNNYDFIVKCEKLEALEWKGDLKHLKLIRPKTLDRIRVYLESDHPYFYNRGGERFPHNQALYRNPNFFLKCDYTYECYQSLQSFIGLKGLSMTVWAPEYDYSESPYTAIFPIYINFPRLKILAIDTYERKVKIDCPKLVTLSIQGSGEKIRIKQPENIRTLVCWRSTEGKSK